MPLIEITPITPDKASSILARLRKAGLGKPRIEDGRVLAMAGGKHSKWLQEIQQTNFRGAASEVRVMTGSDQAMTPYERWKMAMRGRRGVGERFIVYVFEQALARGIVKGSGHDLQTGARVPTAGSVADMINRGVRDELWVVKQRGERGRTTPWIIEVSPEMLAVYRQRRADGDFDAAIAEIRPREHRAPAPVAAAAAPAPVVDAGPKGVAVIQIATEYRVPIADSGKILIEFAQLLHRYCAARAITQRGTITTRVEFAEGG